MTTIENVTIKFSDGKEIALTKGQFEELKMAFERIIYQTIPSYPYYDWTIRPWITTYSTNVLPCSTVGGNGCTITETTRFGD
jgi:hypothetical protein